MQVGAGSSRLVAEDVDGGGHVSPTTDIPLSTPTTAGATITEIVLAADGTPANNGGT